MALVTMWRRVAARPAGNLHATDALSPHDEDMEAAWQLEAREAVARKIMLGYSVSSDELKTAGFNMTEAKDAAVALSRRLDAEHKRLTEPRPRAVPQAAPPKAIYIPDPKPEPEPEQKPARKQQEPDRARKAWSTLRDLKDNLRADRGDDLF